MCSGEAPDTRWKPDYVPCKGLANQPNIFHHRLKCSSLPFSECLQNPICPFSNATSSKSLPCFFFLQPNMLLPSSMLQSPLVISIMLSHLSLPTLYYGYFYTYLSPSCEAQFQGCELIHLCFPHIHNKCSINVLNGLNSINASGSNLYSAICALLLHYQKCE